MSNITRDKKFNELNVTLEVLGLTSDEFLIVGSAAESLVGINKPFTDIDVVVSAETFKRLVSNQFEVTTRGSDSNRVRLIAIGHVKVIEANTDRWLDMSKHTGYELPILNTHEMIEWRIWMGRTKDLLRAWELVALLEKSIPVPDNLIDFNIYTKPTIELCKAYRDRLLNSLPNDLG